VTLDGRSLLPLLTGAVPDWPERYLITQWHRGNVPIRYHNFMIRDSRWKLLVASDPALEKPSSRPQFELYDLANDPMEMADRSSDQPAILVRLKSAYDRWYDDVSRTRPDNYTPPRIHVGTPHEPATVLTRQDWRSTSWSSDAIGEWHLHMAADGLYDVRSVFDPLPNNASLTLTIGQVQRTAPVTAGTEEFDVRNVDVPRGDAKLRVELRDGDRTRGPYQVFIQASKDSP
jgi:hypothetical protein